MLAVGTVLDPNLTVSLEAVPENPVPWMVTEVPPPLLPEVGLIDVTDGVTTNDWVVLVVEPAKKQPEKEYSVAVQVIVYVPPGVLLVVTS